MLHVCYGHPVNQRQQLFQLILESVTTLTSHVLLLASWKL